MSSRRGAGEENILAMLERDSARRLGPRMSGVRLASYGAAAALAGILAGGIAWLAYDNHKSAQELQAAHDTADVGVPVAIPDAVAPPQAPPAIAAAHPVDAPRTAVIVDESPSRREVAVASAAPPLVMLPPHEVNGTKPPPAAQAVQDSAKPARPEPVRTVARVEKKAEKTVKVSAKPTKAPKPAKPAQARSTAPAKAKAKAESTARTRKPAAAADAPVDSDVALISAIIQHSERHRGESGCSGPKCPAKPARP